VYLSIVFGNGVFATVLSNTVFTNTCFKTVLLERVFQKLGIFAMPLNPFVNPFYNTTIMPVFCGNGLKTRVQRQHALAITHVCADPKRAM